MLPEYIRQIQGSNRQINMTPIIDIVFLLIIFFMLVCQFIVAENFPVAVPDQCRFAQSQENPGSQVTTITVMKKAPESGVAFAVGSEKIVATGGKNIASRIAEAVDKRLRNWPSQHSVVSLRADKDVCFRDCQYALVGLAQSQATDVRLAVLKGKGSAEN